MESTRGQLLIAGPTLADPNFSRTVVLIIEHSAEGALGLVLNRPSETTVADVASELEPFVATEEALWVGGPVSPSALIVLAEFENTGDAALIAFEDVGVIATDTTAGPPEIRRGRAFAGHAGWGPGQLDAELEREDWIVEPAAREDAFTSEPDELWSSVLIRKGGSYALVARMPPDPSVN